MPAPSTEPLEVIVSDRRIVADRVVELTLAATDDSALPAWEPGAHVAIQLEADLVRHYSLCGEVGSPTWRISVLRELHGRGGSARIHDTVQVGDVLEVSRPSNHFELVDADVYAFIAGGIGITPLLPMIAEADRRGADWSLFYAGRTRASMAYAAELEARYGDRVTVIPRDEQGRMPLSDIVAAVGEAEVYCCGPEPLLEALGSVVPAESQSRLHFERFTPLEIDDSDDQAFEVILERSGLAVDVARDESVLDAVERVGIRVLSSCREGTCGTCETEILEGEVEHRDAVLSPDEQAANEVMMICVSRSRCPRLVLDL